MDPKVELDASGFSSSVIHRLLTNLVMQIGFKNQIKKKEAYAKNNKKDFRDIC